MELTNAHACRYLLSFDIPYFLLWSEYGVLNQVHLDYDDPEGRKAAIAMVRLPSKYPADSPQYRGPILINPGGPGGCGVTVVLNIGPHLAQIIGPKFDILGFDPRGELATVVNSAYI